jgi:hypothetical protein
MIKEHDTLYVIRNTKNGKLVLSYNPSSQVRKALFSCERTAKDALKYIQRFGDENDTYRIETIS